MPTKNDSKDLRICHITFWYPNKFSPNEALWIQRHIESLPGTNHVYHFEIIPNRSFKVYRNKSHNIKQVILQVPFERWFVFELIFLVWLLYKFLLKRIQYDVEVINFHIAYPMLTYWHWIKRFVKKPIVITEHWSAYHSNFGVSKPLPRIQRIFKQNIPIIAVSNALLTDIKKFANADFPGYVVHNVVDTAIFYPPETVHVRKPFFFMVSQWNYPKRPLVTMEAFLNFNRANPGYRLVVAGYGNQWDEMRNWIKEKNAQESIELVGVLESSQIAENMRTCKAFLHTSDYETFSVVCAEALSCGAPVLASNVGGITEVVGTHGVLLNENTVDSWNRGIAKVISFQSDSSPDYTKYSSEIIGKIYYDSLNKIIGNFNQ